MHTRPSTDPGLTTAHSGEPDVLVITHKALLATDVIELELRRADGSRLPDWAPGAHIDLLMPDGHQRQYSLCGDRWNPTAYRIAVQREPHGRGASIAIHDTLNVGDKVRFGGPRNSFRMAPADRYLFIAGGIGITPLLPMIRQADLLQIDWRLLYLGRSRDRLAYADDLSALGPHVTVHCADERARADLNLWRPEDAAVRVYGCGPARLLDEIGQWEAAPNGFPPKVERFSAVTPAHNRPATEFEVIAVRSGVSTIVSRDETVAAALRRAGVDLLTSCGQGVCGTCETAVIDGEPDHRDSLLDDRERAVSGCMYPCVSRCLSNQLVLDL